MKIKPRPCVYPGCQNTARTRGLCPAGVLPSPSRAVHFTEETMPIEELIKAIQKHQDPELYPFTETLLAVLDNAEAAGDRAGVRVSEIDALQAMQIGIAAIIDGAAVINDRKRPVPWEQNEHP